MILCDKCEKRRECKEFCPERATEYKNRTAAHKTKAIMNSYYFARSAKRMHTKSRQGKR